MEETWELSTWNQGRVGLRKIGSPRPQITFLPNEKLRVHVGRIGRLVQQLWQTKIYVKGGKAGNQGKKNQNMCEYFPNIWWEQESLRHGFSVFPLQFVSLSLIDLLWLQGKLTHLKKNTKWRSMLVQGQTNMTDIVKDWQTMRLLKCSKEANSSWKNECLWGERNT